jgi:hypothetical protein
MRLLLTLLSASMTICLPAQSPVELGDIRWLRSWPEAEARSRAERKPILVLFQEVPGCQTCRTYGSEVLTHPMIVEAAETLFVPLAIHNNKPGPDADVLKRFGEPAWNNPVVRIVTPDGEDLQPRLAGNYSAAGLANAMAQALIRQEGMAPAWLQLLADELTAAQRGTAKATYSMYCFWTGEALFGALNGVVRTTAGFQNGKEVVAVEYDPLVISRAQLDRIAKDSRCFAEAGGSFSPDKTPKYYLANSPYAAIPMTEAQQCRVNAALARKQDPAGFLSPRQAAYR